MSKTYKLIQLPFPLRFSEMSEPALKSYFSWFRDSMPNRLTELTRAVQGTAGFERWQGDFTSASLKQLGNWFAEEVESRALSERELEEERAMNPFPLDDSYFDTTLTNRTFSIAMDIGMYLGSVVEENIPQARWFQPLDDKAFVYYGHACLSGFGVHTLSPVALVITRAYAIADGEDDGSCLHRVFEKWSKLAL